MLSAALRAVDAHDISFEGYTVIYAGNGAYAIFRSRNITVRNVSVYAGHDGTIHAVVFVDSMSEEWYNTKADFNKTVLQI